MVGTTPTTRRGHSPTNTSKTTPPNSKRSNRSPSHENVPTSDVDDFSPKDVTCHATLLDCDVKCLTLVRTGTRWLVWTGEKDGSIFVIDVKRIHHGPLKQIPRMDSFVWCMATDSMARVWAGFADGRVRVWTGDTVEELPLMERHHSGIHSIIYNKGAIYTGANCIYKWDIKTLKVLLRFTPLPVAANIRGMTVDGFTLYSASDDGLIRRWSTETGDSIPEPWRGHQASIKCLCRVNNTIWTGAEDGEIRVWKIENGECVGVLHHDGSIQNLLMVGDKVWSSSTEKSIRIWHPTRLELMDEKIEHNGKVNAMCIVKRAQLYEVWSSGAEPDTKSGAIKIWRVEVNEPITSNLVGPLPSPNGTATPPPPELNLESHQASLLAAQQEKIRELEAQLKTTQQKVSEREFQADQLQSIFDDRTLKFREQIKEYQDMLKIKEDSISKMRSLQEVTLVQGTPMQERMNHVDDVEHENNMLRDQINRLRELKEMHQLRAFETETNMKTQLQAKDETIKQLEKEIINKSQTLLEFTSLVQQASHRINVADVGVAVQYRRDDPQASITSIIEALYKVLGIGDNISKWEPTPQLLIGDTGEPTSMREIVILRRQVASNSSIASKLTEELAERDFAITNMRANITKLRGDFEIQSQVDRRSITQLEQQLQMVTAERDTANQDLAELTMMSSRERSECVAFLKEARTLLNCPKGMERQCLTELLQAREELQLLRNMAQASAGDWERKYREVNAANVELDKLNLQLLKTVEQQANDIQNYQQTIEDLNDKVRAVLEGSDIAHPILTQAPSPPPLASGSAELQFIQDSRQGLAKNLAKLHQQIDRSCIRMQSFANALNRKANKVSWDVIEKDIDSMCHIMRDVRNNHKWLLANFLTEREKTSFGIDPNEFRPGESAIALAGPLLGRLPPMIGGGEEVVSVEETPVKKKKGRKSTSPKPVKKTTKGKKKSSNKKK